MNRNFTRTGLLILAACALLGCSEPPAPPEIQAALEQDQQLWRAGAPLQAPEPYKEYRAALQTGREAWAREKNRFLWFRDYAPVAVAFRQIMTQGQQVEEAIRLRQQTEAGQAASRIERLEKKVRVLRALVARIKDRRLSRGQLVTAEVALDQARKLAAQHRGDAAQQKLAAAEAALDRVAEAIRPILARYADPSQVAAWRRMTDAAIAESRRSGGQLLVVAKLERKLTLYRAGAVVRSWPAGLGFNYLTDKLRSGDKATPEGRYRVVRKNAASKYYLALLLDYPNADDRQRFQQARQKGRIPAGSAIGGLIEIHGGGTEGMTNGCVSLDNGPMQELFERVETGTPVIIVGTLSADNIAAKVLACLK